MIRGILPALVTAFLFQHAVQGWCPPVPILRRLGFRAVWTQPDTAQATLLDRLGVILPKRMRLAEHEWPTLAVAA
jgi:hypothetical protein